MAERGKGFLTPSGHTQKLSLVFVGWVRLQISDKDFYRGSRYQGFLAYLDGLDLAGVDQAVQVSSSSLDKFPGFGNGKKFIGHLFSPVSINAEMNFCNHGRIKTFPKGKCGGLFTFSFWSLASNWLRDGLEGAFLLVAWTSELLAR